MYKISKEFHFSASHVLNGLPESHPCGRLHGHNYIVKVNLSSAQLNNVGFVVDYGELTPLKKYIDDVLDHRHLNDIFDFQPSAENLAKHLFDWCKERWHNVTSISVSETPKTWATYTI